MRPTQNALNGRAECVNADLIDTHSPLARRLAEQ